MPCGRSGFWRGRSSSRPAARAPASNSPSRPGRSSSRPAARAPASNAPSRPASSAPPPAPVQKGNGFGAAIVDGIGWGVGTAMAHRAVDAIVGPCVIKHETVASSEPAAAAAPTPKPNTNNLMNSDAWVINPKL